jgi:hypothetical protein
VLSVPHPKKQIKPNNMYMKTLILFTIIFQLIGFVITAWSVIEKRERLNFFTWFLWTVITAIGFIFSVLHRDWPEIFLTGVFTAGNLTISILLFVKKHFDFGKVEAVVLLVTIICIVLSLAMPEVGPLITGLSIIASGIPSIVMLSRKKSVGYYVERSAQMFRFGNAISVFNSIYVIHRSPTISFCCFAFWTLFIWWLPKVRQRLI